MRSLTLLVAAAIIGTAGCAFAQGPEADDAPKAPDPAQSKAIDEAYRTRCEAKVSKELCACVITVADAEIADPGERQIYFDYMMGDVDKAKAARALFSPRKAMTFGAAMQKADIQLGERCDKLKAQQPAGGAEAPKPN